jgi:hypothetical protein
MDQAWRQWRVVETGELDRGERKLVPLICKRGTRSDGQYREQGEGAYHARFFLCFISLPKGMPGFQALSYQG